MISPAFADGFPKAGSIFLSQFIFYLQQLIKTATPVLLLPRIHAPRIAAQPQ